MKAWGCYLTATRRVFPRRPVSGSKGPLRRRRNAPSAVLAITCMSGGQYEEGLAHRVATHARHERECGRAASAAPARRRAARQERCDVPGLPHTVLLTY